MEIIEGNLNSKNVISFLLVFILGLSFFYQAEAQSLRAKNWAFPMGNRLIFETNGVVTDTSNAIANDPNPTINKGTSTISDEDGNLVMYSNGETAWNANHDVIMNGSGLEGSQFTTQTSIIIPWPQIQDRYFLFTLDSLAAPVGLYYYIVDMALNGGAGMVFPGPTLLLDTITEKLAATHHANDEDYWVVAHEFGSNEFYSYKVDINGVDPTPVVSAAGTPHDGPSGSARGQMKISPDGTKIAVANDVLQFVELFDFDNETGVVSNPITLATGPQNQSYGLEFSADSKKLYYAQAFSDFNNPAEIVQYDLDHVNEDCLLASKTIAAIPNFLKIMRDMQLGLDKKIYVTYDFPVSFNDSLGVINEPHLMAPDCDFQEAGLTIADPSNHVISSGLTNFASSYVSDGIFVEFGTNCFGDSTIFWPEDTADVDSVRWVFGDPGSGSNTGTGIPAKHLYTSNDTFSVTLYRYEGNQADTFHRDVIVWDKDPNILGNDTTVCAGQTVTLDATFPNSCLEWSNGSSNSTINVSSEDWYWVDVAHQSCLFRDSVFVTTVQGPPQFNLGNDTSVCAGVSFDIDPDLQNAFYTWQDGSHDTTFTVTNTGLIWLEASNACGATRDSLNVTLDLAAQPILNFPEDTTVCDTVPLTLDVTFDLASYQWSDGTTDPVKTIETSGEYWVIVGNSCDTVSDTINVNIDPAAVSALVDRNVLCDQNDELTLVATQTLDSVIWNTGITNDSLTVSSSGSYSYLLSNTCGQLRDTIEILDWDENYRVDIGNDTSICELDDTLVISVADDLFPFSYSWTGTNVNGPSLPITEPGIYTIEATNRCTTQIINRSIRTVEAISIEDPRTTNVCDGERIELSVFPAESISWSNGDSSRTIFVSEEGTYSVLITDSNGCEFRDSISFTSLCEPAIYVPNVFTPNADGINDNLCVEVENLNEFEIVIFNRWGVSVYESSNPSLCWDGDALLDIAPAGVYYYLIRATGTDGEEIEQRGSATLLR